MQWRRSENHRVSSWCFTLIAGFSDVVHNIISMTLYSDTQVTSIENHMKPPDRLERPLRQAAFMSHDDIRRCHCRHHQVSTHFGTFISSVWHVYMLIHADQWREDPLQTCNKTIILSPVSWSAPAVVRAGDFVLCVSLVYNTPLSFA
jgi:hypothetical protein